MAIQLAGNTVIHDNQNVQVSGVTTASSFVGDGSQLTNLPASGGTLEATASGTLADGSKVIVNTDGTVSVVAQSETTGPGSSPSGSFTGDTDATIYVSSVYDPDTQKLIVVYADTGGTFSSNGGPLRAVVATVSGTSISFGSPSTLSGNIVQYTSIAYDSTNDKVVIAYQDESQGRVGKAVVGTVDGSNNTVSFGTPVTFSGSDTADFTAIIYDSNSQKIVIAYREYGNNYGGVGNGRAIVGTVSGTSISFGSSTIFAAGSGGAWHISLVYHPIAQKVVLTCSDDTNSGYPTSRVGTVSGTSISFGTAVVINSRNGSYVRSLYDPDTEKVIVAYPDYNSSGSGTAKVGTVSGTSISFGSASVFNSGNTVTIAMAYEANTQKTIICFTDRANGDLGTFVSGTVSGTSITFSSETIFTNEKTWDTAPVYDSSAQKMAVFHTLSDNTLHNPVRAATSKIIGSTGFSVPSVGSPEVFESATMYHFAAAYDSSNQKVVIAYGDGGNSYYGTAIVGTVSGTSISFGTPVIFNTADSKQMSAIFDSTNNKVIITYKDMGNSGHGAAIVGTVSGTSISFGSEVVFEPTNYINQRTSAVYDSTNNKVVIAYGYITPPGAYYGAAVVGTVSGTSISFGSSTIFETGHANWVSAVHDSTNNKIVISYQDVDNSNYGKAVVGTISGTSISFGSITTFESAASYYNAATFDSSNGKVVIVYKSTQGKAIVGTVSGTSISFGTPVVYNTAGSGYASIVYDSSNQKVVIAYSDPGNSNYGTAAIGTVSGTSISFGTPVVFETALANYIPPSVYDSTNQKVVITYADGGNSDYGTAVVFSPTTMTTNLTSENFIGISDASYTNGQTATIQISGSIDDAQSGLTPGQKYYVQDDGTLAESGSVLAGTAVASTKLIING